MIDAGSRANLGGFAALGRPHQLGFVPKDFDAALRFWTQTMGVGPFFLMDRIRAEKLTFRGQPTAFEFSAALAYWGDVQVELVVQHDSVPSIFTEWRAEDRDGLHHLCMLVADLDEARAIAAQSNAEVLQELEVGGGASRIIYVDTGGGPGTILELVQSDKARMDQVFLPMQEAARNWDGRDSLRRL